MWNIHGVWHTNMVLISKSIIQPKNEMHYLTNKHYTLTSLGKRLTLQGSLYFYETLSYVQSNLFLRTSSWAGRWMTPASTRKLYAELWSHLTWNIICPKKAISFVMIMLYKIYFFIFSFLISFSWEFQILLCSRLHRKFHVSFLGVGMKMDLPQ